MNLFSSTHVGDAPTTALAPAQLTHNTHTTIIASQHKHNSNMWQKKPTGRRFLQKIQQVKRSEQSETNAVIDKPTASNEIINNNNNTPCLKKQAKLFLL